MQAESCCCGDCRTDNRSAGFDVEDGQWLEVLGDMIETAVEGIRKEQSFSSCYNGRLFAV